LIFYLGLRFLARSYGCYGIRDNFLLLYLPTYFVFDI